LFNVYYKPVNATKHVEALTSEKHNKRKANTMNINDTSDMHNKRKRNAINICDTLEVQQKNG